MVGKYTDNIGAGFEAITPLEIYDALHECRFNIAKTAASLDMTRAALKYRIDGNPTLSTLYADRKQAILDSAEGNVFDAVESGDLASSKFVLTTLGADRGYKAGLELASGLEVVIRNITQEVKDAERLAGPERLHGDVPDTEGARGSQEVGKGPGPAESGE